MASMATETDGAKRVALAPQPLKAHYVFRSHATVPESSRNPCYRGTANAGVATASSPEERDAHAAEFLRVHFGSLCHGIGPCTTTNLFSARDVVQVTK
jgi:hypothetical protein